jgi:hypothetical protein
MFIPCEKCIWEHLIAVVQPAKPIKTRLLCLAMLVLDAVLNIFLQITKARLDFADVLLDISFYLHTLVV